MATFVPGIRIAPGLLGSARYLLTSKNDGVGEVSGATAGAAPALDTAAGGVAVSARAAVGTRSKASGARRRHEVASIGPTTWVAKAEAPSVEMVNQTSPYRRPAAFATEGSDSESDGLSRPSPSCQVQGRESSPWRTSASSKPSPAISAA